MRIYCRPHIPPSLVPAPAGTWSVQGPLDMPAWAHGMAASPTPRKQLPQTKLTGHSTVYLAAPYFGTWDSQAIPRACTAMAWTLVDLLSTTTTTTATGVAKPFHRRSRCSRRTRICTRTAHHHRPLKLTTPTAPGTQGRTPRTLRTEPPIQTSRASDLACQG